MELRELIFDAITVHSPCRDCDFWDRQGHYCYLKDVHSDANKCLLVYQILKLIREAGYVKLSDDQSLPKNPYPRMTQCADEDGAIQTFTNPDWMKFHQAEDAMLKAGFRRVEL